MANTDISVVSKVVQITFAGDTNSILALNQITSVTYQFVNSGTILRLNVGNDQYEILFSQLTVGGVAPASVAAAYVALSNVFPSLGGGGGGGVAGVSGDLVDNTDPENPVIDLAGTLGGDRVVDLDGHSLNFQNDGTDWFVINPITGGNTLRSFNDTDDGNQAAVDLTTSPTEANAILTASFNDGVKEAQISAFADATTSTLTYTADEHIWNGDFKSGDDIVWDLDGHSLFFRDVTNSRNYLELDPTSGNAVLEAFNATGGGNYSHLSNATSNTEASSQLYATFNNGAKETEILAFADATTSTITYTADSHTLMGNVGIGGDPGADVFLVRGGSIDAIKIDPTTTFTTLIRMSDNTALTTLQLVSDVLGTNVSFLLEADNDSDPVVSILGDAIAQTITMTAANGVDASDFFSVGGDPGVDADLSAITSITVKGGIITDIQGTP